MAELKADADTKANEADRAQAQAQARLMEIEALIAKQIADKAVVESMKAEAEAQELEAQAQLAGIENELAGIIAAQRVAPQEAANARGRGSRRSGPAPICPRIRGRPRAGIGCSPTGGTAPSGSVSGSMLANPTSIRTSHVTSEYGMRMHPILGYVRLHAGIDLRTYCNTPFYTPRAGTVQWAEWRNGLATR